MTTPADFSNERFSAYLRSRSDASWWKTYAFMDEINESTWFEFALDSKTEDKPKQPGEKPTEKTLAVQRYFGCLSSLRFRHQKKYVNVLI